MIEVDFFSLLPGFLIVFPVVFLIHELGHAFFATLVGARVTKITLGRGRTLIDFGGLQVNLFYFLGGLCQWQRQKKLNRVQSILVLLGGILFNLGTALAVWFGSGMDFWEDSLRGDFVWYSLVVAVFSALPYSEFGRNTDGKQILHLIRYGQSSYDMRFDPSKNEMMEENEHE